MAVYSFPGGIRLPEEKIPKKGGIRALPMPRKLVLSPETGEGVLCTPLVRPGEAVLVGQKIASDDEGRCPLHSPVSGRVEGILPAADGPSGHAAAILLENDFRGRKGPSLAPFGKSLLHASREELLCVIREAGIPLFAEGGKPLVSRLEKLAGSAKTVILNAVRREPWITGGYRLMLENPGAVIGGLKILLKLLSVRGAILALEAPLREAERALREIEFDKALLKTVLLKSKYPGSLERPLVSAATGKPLPAGKTAEECGILQVDPETLAAVYQAFVNGMPVTRRIVSIGGDGTVTPGDYFLPLGMSLLSAADFLKTEEGLSPAALGEYTAILHGRMSGEQDALKRLFVSKGVAAVYLQREAPALPEEGACVRCGRCMEVCPAGLPPVTVYRFLKKGREEEARRFRGDDCIGCGCCSLVCPGGVRLSQTIFGWKKSGTARSEAPSQDAAKKTSLSDADFPSPSSKDEAKDLETFEKEGNEAEKIQKGDEKA